MSGLSIARPVVTVVAAALLVCALAFPVTADADKVTVCHKPDTPAGVTIDVANSALDAHLAHGDNEGACVTPSGFQAACEGLGGTFVPDHIGDASPYGFIPMPACYFWTDCGGDWPTYNDVLAPYCVSLFGSFCASSPGADPDYYQCNPCPGLGC